MHLSCRPGDFTNAIGQAVFTKQLYCAQVAQALLVKSDISTRRGRNSFGTVTWQHSEVWPTGGWGSLEYGTQSAFTKGQVLGGRWKPVRCVTTTTVISTTVISSVCY